MNERIERMEGTLQIANCKLQVGHRQQIDVAARTNPKSKIQDRKRILLLAWFLFAANYFSDAACAQDPLPAAPVSASGLIPQRNLLQIIKAGGILMVPIIFCSFITLVFVFERAIALRRRRVIPRPFVKRFLHQLSEGQLDKEKAMSLCEENGSPVAQVFAGAVKKWGRPAVEVEQAVLDAGERASNGLRKYIRIFNAVSTISPLLGLLGTVFGMIKAFNDISTSDAMGKPELLSRGISEALITTAAGLSIAIPALVCYLFFLSRVDQLIIEIDALGQDVVSAISAESLQITAKSTRSRSREPATP